MNLQEFVNKWDQSKLTESAAAQEHFLDLCALLGQPTPATADPDGSHYTFERGARKTDGGEGWADVWKKGFFGWEYKGKRKDLAAAYRQLLQYHEALDSPPLLVVCDLDRFEVHTKFTNAATKVYAFDLKGLGRDPAHLDVLRRVFTDPESLKPGVSRETITKEVAEQIGQVADSMRNRKVPAEKAAHFLMRLMFCMFAEDIGLLPAKMFSRIMENSKRDPERLTKQLRTLFGAMAHGGDFGADPILHFNGGLFTDAEVEKLEVPEIQHICDATIPDWAEVEPSVFGTLFERFLDPTKRSQIGAHYTSRDDIETIVKPVVMDPLRREWAEIKAKCETLWPKIQEADRKTAKAGKKVVVGKVRKASKPRAAVDKLLTDFVHRLAHVRILDPACGSGNFLYVAINLLLYLEKEVTTYMAIHGVTQLPQVRPTQLLGIEINRYAQELAQIVIWIGYLQWMHSNGFNPPRDPVLDPIETIQCADAIVDLTDPANPMEPEWPDADFIVGNPPFLGAALFFERGVTEEYTRLLAKLYDLPGKSDLCCYWFEKSRRMIVRNKSTRVGLLATQAIRHGGSRHVLEAIAETGGIFFAESDRGWILDGASVRVSMVGFDGGSEKTRLLDGQAVPTINNDLSSGTNTTVARTLRSNLQLAFEGDQKGGDFDAPWEIFSQMISMPNPSGFPNSDVMMPRANAETLVKVRELFTWVIDFGPSVKLEAASQYEAPFEYIREHVYEARQLNRVKAMRENWWLHKRPRPEMRRAILQLDRYIVTSRVGKHRIFVWLSSPILADSRLFVFAMSDDFSFGVLQSRLHEVWTLRQGARHGVGNDPTYNTGVCFETFPFPDPIDDQREAIAESARELDRYRTAWLNPPEWTREEILEFPGSADGPWRRYVTNPNARGIGTVRYPRLIPRDAETAKQLAKRTLTNLYNKPLTQLKLAHRKLDEAVFAAYGWPPDLTDDQILEKLLALNLQRAAR